LIDELLVDITPGTRPLRPRLEEQLRDCIRTVSRRADRVGAAR
jgi:hypothetical protein